MKDTLKKITYYLLRWLKGQRQAMRLCPQRKTFYQVHKFRINNNSTYLGWKIIDQEFQSF